MNKTYIKTMKSNRMKLMFFLALCFGLMLNYVSAVPPVQSTLVADEGLEIEATNLGYLEKDVYHNFRFRVYNASTNKYLNDTDVNCSLGIVNEKGDYFFSENPVSATDYVFSVNVSAGNFSDVGIYHQGINCITNDGEAGGVKTLSFEVTLNGLAPDKAKAIIQVGFFLLLFAISCYFMLLAFQIQQPGFRVFFIFLSFVLLMTCLIFSFIAAYETNVYENFNNAMIKILFAVGIVLIIIFVYIMIEQTKAALNLMQSKKGYELDF